MSKKDLSSKLVEIVTLGRTRFYLVVVAFLFAVAAIPILIVDIPALGDYINHLARSHIVASIEIDPLLNKYYEVRWALFSNLGMDLVVPFLARFIDIYAAGKIFVLTIFGLIISGVIAVNYSIYKKLSLTPIFVFLFIYNTVLLFGFMNYLFGLGLSLWAIATYIWFREYHPLNRIVVSLIAIFVLFVCHLYAVGLYGFTIGCYELWRLREKGIKDKRALFIDALILALLLIFVILLLSICPTSELSTRIKAARSISGFLREKLNAIEWLIGLYHYKLDRIIGAIIAALSLYALRKRLLYIHPVGWLVLIFGIILYAMMPNVLFGSWGAAYRLPIAILFIFIGFSQWKLTDFSSRAIFAGAVFVILLLRVIQVGTVWTMYDQVYAEIRKGFNHIKPGSAITHVLKEKPPPWPYRKALPLNHSDCIAVIESSAFTPHLWSGKINWVLSIKPDYNKLKEERPPMLELRELVEMNEIAPEDQNSRRYWKYGQGRSHYWKRGFDYLYVLYTNNSDINPLPNSLDLIYQGKAFKIYKIIKPSMITN